MLLIRPADPPTVSPVATTSWNQKKGVCYFDMASGPFKCCSDGLASPNGTFKILSKTEEKMMWWPCEVSS